MKVTLYNIPTISSIKELEPYYNDMWAYVRSNITTDDIAGDIVNNVVLRLHGYFENGKEVNGSFIALTLWSEYQRHLKQQQKISYNDYPLVEDSSDDDINIKEEEEFIYKEYEQRINKLSWYEQKVLKYSLEMPLIELSRQTGISYYSLRNTLIKVKNKLNYE